MSKLPYTRIYIGPIHTIAISGAHIQILDTSTGSILNSTAKPDTELNVVVLKSGPIRCAAVDDAFKYIATTTDDKVLRVWEVEGLKIINERDVAKRPTDIKFTKNGKTILVSDKFGDVFTYDLHPPLSLSASEGPSAVSEGTKSDKPSTNGSLLLGHASLLTTFLLTPDEKYIITADRDEHIRVSWYPEAYVIEEYCLGHEKFVSALHIPPWDATQLISGGGDPMLKFWNWETGSLSYELYIADVIMPFVKVKRPKGKARFEDGDEEDGADGAEKRVSARQRRKVMKKKGKGKEREDYIDDDMEDIGSEHNDKIPTIEEDSTTADGDAILVVQKISTMMCGTDRLLLLTAVGSSALFYCTYPEASTASTTEIRCLDFGKPILDFVHVSENEIYVAIDAEWNMVDSSHQAPNMVHCAIYSNNMFVESSETSRKALLHSLNVDSILSAVTPADLQTLDLYSSLVIYPKLTHRGADFADHVKSDELEIPGEENESVPDSTGSKKPKLTKKQGRLKRKQALLAKMQNSVEIAALNSQDAESDTKKVKGEAHEDDNNKMDM